LHFFPFAVVERGGRKPPNLISYLDFDVKKFMLYCKLKTQSLVKYLPQHCVVINSQKFIQDEILFKNVEVAVIGYFYAHFFYIK
jgi:hypothetical protein